MAIEIEINSCLQYNCKFVLWANNTDGNSNSKKKYSTVLETWQHSVRNVIYDKGNKFESSHITGTLTSKRPSMEALIAHAGLWSDVGVVHLLLFYLFPFVNRDSWSGLLLVVHMGDILVTKKSVWVFMMPLSFLMVNNVMQRNIQLSKVLETLRRKWNKSFHNISGSPLCIFFFFFILTMLTSFA